jgi:phenylacetate-CoA ligase
MKTHQFVAENVILPLSDFLTKGKVYKFHKLLKESQFWTRGKIDDYQNELLMRLIHHTYNYVPYYHDLFNSIKLKPEDIKSKKDLYKIPILNKQVIKKEGIERFTSSTYPKSKIVPGSSSGSTGEPLFYHNTFDAYSLGLASNLRGWYWMGFHLGDKYVKLSQNARKNIIKKFQDKFSRNLYLSINPLIDSNFEYVLKQIEDYKPLVIRCYPDPLLFLARYKQENPRFNHIPLAITTTGNTLFPETRQEIEKAFGCEIFDSYSCEGNALAFECPTHSCYHSAEEYGISEVLDENNNLIVNGVGRLLSTDLHNLVHPFIRYDTQDFVEIDDRPCECGRALLRFNKILGRDNEVLFMPNGRRFIVHNFTGFFQVDNPKINKGIDQFQVIKLKNGSILFRMVVNSNYNQNVGDFIQLFWEKEFEMPVKIEIVNNIPLTKSGKRRFILNEV